MKTAEFVNNLCQKLRGLLSDIRNIGLWET